MQPCLTVSCSLRCQAKSHIRCMRSLLSVVRNVIIRSAFPVPAAPSPLLPSMVLSIRPILFLTTTQSSIRLTAKFDVASSPRRARAPVVVVVVHHSVPRLPPSPLFFGLGRRGSCGPPHPVADQILSHLKKFLSRKSEHRACIRISSQISTLMTAKRSKAAFNPTLRKRHLS